MDIELEDRRAKLPIIAKVAFTPEQQASLVREGSIYMHMAAEGIQGIPLFVGIYHDIQQDGPSCLIICDIGVSLQDRDICISSNQRSVSAIVYFRHLSVDRIQCRDAFLAILRSIHHADILHGNLTLDNLLVKDTGDVIIAGFDQAQMEAPQQRLEEEHEQLLKLFSDAHETYVSSA